MKHVLVALAVAAAGSVISGADLASQDPQPSGTRASQARATTIYAAVVDDKGVPVPGLTADEFIVREDGVVREVLKAGPATDPMQVALLVDDSQAATGAIPYIRDGLTAFIDALKERAEMAIITVGERPTSVVQYTSSVEELKRGVGRIFARPGSGAYLTEAINDASRGIQKRKAARPVIVVLSIEAVEFSTLHYQQVLKELYASGATLHVIGLGTTTAAMNDEMRSRNTVIVDGTDNTGGRRDTLLTPQAIPDRMKQLADELLNQYAVTYARADTLIPAERVSVSVKRPGLTVRARTRTGAAR
jgi:Ca-activated chloride channel family protein